MFTRIGRALLGRPAGSALAYLRLRAVADGGGTAELRAVGSPEGAPMTVRILAVTRRELIVDGSGAAARSIGRFSRFEIAIPGDGPPSVGDVECIGRIRAQHPDGRTVPAFRLSMPESLRPVERRREARVSINKGIAEAQLKVLGRQGPIQAMVEDISERGARVRCRNGHGDVREGGHAHFRSELPAPIGTVDDMARVLAVEMEKDTGDMVLRLQFAHKVESLAKKPAGPKRLSA